jgi:hypothetical protein
MPSGMRVGRQRRPRLRPNRALVETNQRNAASAPVKRPGPLSTGGLATAPPVDNSSKAKLPNAQVPVPATTRANGAALATSAASAATVEALHNALGGQRVDADDGPQRACERGAHSDPLAPFGFLSVPFNHVFLFLVVRLVRPIRRSESLLRPGHDI